jgi:hypothetical protein
VYLAKSICLSFLIACTAKAVDRVRIVPVPEHGEPAVARSDARGDVHLIFNSRTGPRYAKWDEIDKRFSPPLPVVNGILPVSGLEFAAWDMAVGPEGRVHVALGSNAWKLKRPKEEWAFYYARLDPGAKTFSPLQNINRQSSEGFSLAADGAGNVTACWLSGKLFANISHDNGKTFGPNVEIDSAIDPCDCCTTSSTYAKDGMLAVLYREETDDQRDIFLVFWDQARNKTRRVAVSTTLWKINGCPMTYFTVTKSRSGFVTVWPTKGHVYFARLGQDGALLPPGEVKTAVTTGMRTGLLALGASSGNTLIVWKDHHELRWQLFDQNGKPSGTSGIADSAGKGVAGVVDQQGDFILFP